MPPRVNSIVILDFCARGPLPARGRFAFEGECFPLHALSDPPQHTTAHRFALLLDESGLLRCGGELSEAIITGFLIALAVSAPVLAFGLSYSRKPKALTYRQERNGSWIAEDRKMLNGTLTEWREATCGEN